MALCNAGLRDRHWDAMSEVAGRVLKPNEESTLQNFVDMNLTKFLEKFDVISEGASKECVKARS
jgi:dynein heavy chain